MKCTCGAKFTSFPNHHLPWCNTPPDLSSVYIPIEGKYSIVTNFNNIESVTDCEFTLVNNGNSIHKFTCYGKDRTYCTSLYLMPGKLTWLVKNGTATITIMFNRLGDR